MDGFLYISFAIALYFAPWLVATSRGRHNSGAIFALNLFLGWTLVGWVVALVWALSDSKPAETSSPSVTSADAARVPCPRCSELILPTAKLCKHCGSEIAAKPELSEDEKMAKYNIRKDGVIYHYKEWRYDKLSDAIAMAEKDR